MRFFSITAWKDKGCCSINSRTGGLAVTWANVHMEFITVAI